MAATPPKIQDTLDGLYQAIRAEVLEEVLAALRDMDTGENEHYADGVADAILTVKEL